MRCDAMLWTCIHMTIRINSKLKKKQNKQSGIDIGIGIRIGIGRPCFNKLDNQISNIGNNLIP